MPKVLFEKTVNGNTVLVNATTPAGNQGAFVLQMVKGKSVDDKFWYWPSIPAGQVIGCDFTNAPVIPDGATAADVNTIIAGITASPEDVLTYA